MRTSALPPSIEIEGEEPGFDGLSDLTEIPNEATPGVTSEMVGGFKVISGPGFAEVVFDDTPPQRASVGHDENLAELLQESELATIAQRVLEWAEVDEEARKPWLERIKAGMKLMGIETLEDGDLAIPGQSKLTHPLIAEACVQFQARAMEELFPPEGPVKTTVIGERTQATEEQAMRVQDYMNYRLLYEDEEYVEDKDKMTFVLPAHGSTFTKLYRDPVTRKALSRSCEGGSVLVPYNATSLDSSPRISHKFSMDINDVRRAMAIGSYRDVPLTPATPPSTEDSHRELTDEADDAEAVVAQDDDNRNFIECHCNLSLSVDEVRDAGFELPYIVTVDKDSQAVLEIRRNWKQNDPLYQRRRWFVHHKYLPGFGVYGFGLLHLIGVLAQAAGGALRALLDAAAAASFQGGFKTRENKLGGSFKLRFGEWQDTDMSADELQKGFYTPPFKEPSPALFNLLDMLVKGGQRFSSITEAMVGDLQKNMPVGTIVSIIEQGSKVFSGIHKRLHNSHRREYGLLAGLYGEDIDHVYPYETVGGAREVLRSDFDGRVDVFPVSDPNIYSGAQRIAIAQGTLELIKSEPALYDEAARREAHRRMFRAMRVPEFDKLLPEKKVKRLDPVSENQGFMTGHPAKAFPEQDHEAHLAVHIQFMSGLGEEDAKGVMPVMMAHVAEHKAYLYRQNIERALGRPLPQNVALGEQEEMPVQLENVVAQAVAQSGAAAGPGGGAAQGGPGGEEQAAQQQQQAQAMQDLHGKILDGQRKLERMAFELDKARDALAREKADVLTERKRVEDTARSQERDIGHARAELRADSEAARMRIENMLAKLDLKLEQIRTAAEIIKQQMDAEPPKDETEKKARDEQWGKVAQVLAEALEVVRAPRVTDIKRNPQGRAEQFVTRPEGGKPEPEA